VPNDYFHSLRFISAAFKLTTKRGYRDLSDEEKAMIALLVTQGKSEREIAKKIGCAKSQVGKWKHRFLAGESLRRRPGSGRPRKLTVMESRETVLKAKRDHLITTREIRQELGREDVCLSTINRAIHRHGELKSYWQTNKVFISEVNQKKRVKWCKDHLHWTSEDWNKVMFSDESPYVLRFNGRRRVWRRHNERYHIKALKGLFKNDLKINVWGCFCAHGVGRLHRIEGIMDSKVYIKILDNELRPSVKALFRRKPYIFHQDNDSKHKSKLTMQYLEDSDIPYHPWPPQSPDLCPLENLWSILDFRCKRRMPKNAETLFNNLAKEWGSLDKELLQNLVDSMPRRLEAVIKAKGLPTHY
jgi:ketohexokinase/beta-glucosidase